MTTLLAELTLRFYRRWRQCESAGGCYSNIYEHHSTCPAWRRSAVNDYPCVCGRDELANLEAAIEAELRRVEK